MMTMPASPEYLEKLRDLLKSERSRTRQNKILDAWIEASKMASDYDAEQWGFEPDWCAEELLALRANSDRVTRQGHAEK